jgi:hypothetical protein
VLRYQFNNAWTSIQKPIMRTADTIPRIREHSLKMGLGQDAMAKHSNRLQPTAPRTRHRTGVRGDSRFGNGSTACDGLRSAGVKGETIRGNIAP